MRRIPLRDRTGRVIAEALVDDQDYARLSCHAWHLQSGGYAARSIKRSCRQMILMHRVVAAAGTGRSVDHINGDKLDNRRANLRLVTHAENLENRPGGGNRRGSSRFRGVAWHPGAHKWMAQICHRGRSIYGGLFDEEIKAAQRADELRREYMACAGPDPAFISTGNYR